MQLILIKQLLFSQASTLRYHKYTNGEGTGILRSPSLHYNTHLCTLRPVSLLHCTTYLQVQVVIKSGRASPSLPQFRVTEKGEFSERSVVVDVIVE